MFVLSKQRDLYNTFLPTPVFHWGLLSDFSSISKLERFHVAFGLSGVESIQSDLRRVAGRLRGRQKLGRSLDLDTSLVIGLAMNIVKHRNDKCDVWQGRYPLSTFSFDSLPEVSASPFSLELIWSEWPSSVWWSPRWSEDPRRRFWQRCAACPPPHPSTWLHCRPRPDPRPGARVLHSISRTLISYYASSLVP